jgi:hypothetical protein
VDLLLDLGCKEGIEARDEIGFALDLADLRSFSQSCGKRMPLCHSLRVVPRHSRLEFRPPFAKRVIGVAPRERTAKAGLEQAAASY